MPKLAKIHDCEWGDVEGVFSAVFVGRDSARREVRIAVPAAAVMTTIASDARRRLAARVKLGSYDTVAGAWNQVGFLRADTVELGVTIDDKVGLVLDPGAETEFALSIDSELARALGEKLIETANHVIGKQASTAN